MELLTYLEKNKKEILEIYGYIKSISEGPYSYYGVMEKHLFGSYSIRWCIMDEPYEDYPNFTLVFFPKTPSDMVHRIMWEFLEQRGGG